MPKLTVIDRQGDERTIDAKTGSSIMEALRSNGFDDLLALCGGCCSCATCHVQIDAAFVDLLPAMEEEEDDLFDSSGNRTETSRLSCQVEVSDALDGLKLRIASEG